MTQCVHAVLTNRSSLLQPCSWYVGNTSLTGIAKITPILHTGTSIRQGIASLSGERPISAHWSEIWWTSDQWRVKSVPLWHTILSKINSVKIYCGTTSYPGFSFWFKLVDHVFVSANADTSCLQSQTCCKVWARWPQHKSVLAGTPHLAARQRQKTTSRRICKFWHTIYF
jgi:hypothetical protein